MQTNVISLGLVLACTRSPTLEEAGDGDTDSTSSLESEDSYPELVNVQATQVDMLLVAPGAPEDSYLWHKLNDTHGDGVAMPWGQPLLDAETLDRIETWIAMGAPP